jgi:Uma2 family endonuclease
MVTPEKSKLYTMEEFLEFALRPGNAGREFELINGGIREVMPGRTSNSEFRDIVAFAVRLFCREHNIACHTSGEAGAYRIGSNVLVPDFAYKRTLMSTDYPDPEPPLWVVEVISPTDEKSDIEKKRKIYLDAGILLWELYPDSQRTDVYAPGKKKRTFAVDETLDGGDVLPGFKLPVRDLFPG